MRPIRPAVFACFEKGARFYFYAFDQAFNLLNGPPTADKDLANLSARLYYYKVCWRLAQGYCAGKEEDN